MRSSSRIRSTISTVPILIAATISLLAAGAALAGAEGASRFECSGGLIVYLYAPASPEATLLRTPEGLELRASRPLLTVTRSMVKDALIARYHVYRAPEDRKHARERKGLRETFYWVALQLNSSGRAELYRVLAGQRNAELVVVCDEFVLTARALGGKEIEEINVLINEGAEAAEQFARSLTSNVRFEQHTPPPE